MKTITRVLLLAALILTQLTAMATSQAPDFTKPRQASARAAKALERAVKADDGPEALKALIDISLLETQVNPDKMTEALTRLNDTRARMADNAAFAAMSQLLEARMLTEVYTDDRWKYDSREVPAGTALSADPTQWSGGQFAARIRELTDSVMGAARVLSSTPTADYAACLTEMPRRGLPLWPTLLDVAAPQCADLLTDVSNSRAMRLAARRCLETRLRYTQAGSPARIAASLALIDEKYDARNNADDDARFKALLDLYDENSGSEYASMVLAALDRNLSAGDPGAKMVYQRAGEWLEAHPGGAFGGCVESLRQGLSKEELSFRGPEQVPPDEPVTLSVNVQNVETAQLLVYAVDADPDKTDYHFNPAMPPRQVGAVDVVRPEGAEVPYAAEVKAEVTFPGPGQYVILPLIAGVTPQKQTLEVINCTRLAVATAQYDKTRLWALDPADGAPVAGATVKKRLWNRAPKTYEDAGATGPDGSCEVSPKAYYMAVKDGSRSAVLNVNAPSEDGGTRDCATLWTALPLYRPGDTVDFVAVAWTASPEGCEAMKARTELEMILYDANGSQVESMTLATDGYGRASGRFTLPATGLTGRFSIAVRPARDSFDMTRHFFMVSDYKLPSFSVEDVVALRDAPSRGAVTLRGKAVTYSGFPLTGARVAVTLDSYSRPWWWAWRTQAPEQFYTAETETGDGGVFTLVVPAGVLAEAPWPDGLFRAQIDVTDGAGETQQGSTFFSRGPKWMLSLDCPGTQERRGASVGVKAFDADGREGDFEVAYTLRNAEESVVAEGRGRAGATIALPTASLRPGRYELTVESVRPDESSSQTATFTLYGADCDESPVNDPVWTPSTSLEATAGGRLTIPVWTPRVTHARVAVWSPVRGVMSETWQRLEPGRNEVTVTAPANMDESRVTISAMSGYQANTLSLTLRDPALSHIMLVKAESMRDREQPGGHVRWRFRLSCPGAMALTLYNEALNALEPLRWDLHASATRGVNYRWEVSAMPGGVFDYGYSPEGRRYDCNVPDVPDIETYGYDFMPRRVYEMMYSRATKVDGAMPMEMPDEAILDNSTVESDAAEGPDNGPEQRQPFAYRDHETALALFRPLLTSNADGTVDLEFTLPNANATWLLRAVAWDKQMAAGELLGSVLANKPLMVRPNLPRFLRHGDEAGVEALVMNNGEARADVTGTVEVVTAADERVLVSQPFKVSVEPGAAATVSTRFDVPDAADCTMLRYRIRATAGAFTDGEQALLPVLESRQPVIESRRFVMGSEQREAVVEVAPVDDPSAVTTLNVIENPMWTVVTALPGLSSMKLNTAPSAARAIFSAAIADGIMKRSPEVAKALREWQRAGASDSALTSMLERNPQLKSLVLEATPWMEAAANDTRRMQRLALLLDRKAVEQTIAAGVACLTALRRADGGFAWCGGSRESSYWATEEAIVFLGHLNMIDMMPTDKRLAELMRDAISWYDAETIRQYNEYPRGNYTAYTWARLMWPDVQRPSAANRIVSSTVQQLTGRWADLTTPMKAAAAIILNRTGYAATARVILDSLREYAETTADGGLWWPSLPDDTPWRSMNAVSHTALVLDAFREVEPGCKELEPICQWLILQKEGQDWGDEAATSTVVASIVGAVGRWLEPARGLDLTFDGQQLEATPFDRLSGSYSMRLPEPADTAALRVVKAAGRPAYGSVMRQYSTRMAIDTAAIEAQPGNLAITRHIYRMRGGAAEELPPDGVVEAGATLRVELVIDCPQALDYVAVIDNRAACLEPVNQLPTTDVMDGHLWVYRECRDASTQMFIDRLPRGTWHLHYDVTANNPGTYLGGACTVQSQYAPSFVARTPSMLVTVGH